MPEETLGCCVVKEKGELVEELPLRIGSYPSLGPAASAMDDIGGIAQSHVRPPLLTRARSWFKMGNSSFSLTLYTALL